MDKAILKRVSAIIFALVSFSLFFSFNGFAYEKAGDDQLHKSENYQYDIEDATFIQRYCAFLSGLTDSQYELFDVNFDGFVSVGDASLIQMHAAGFIDINSVEYQSRNPKSKVKPAPDETIPNYIDTEAKRLASVVKSHKTENSVSFICCSDLHEDGTGSVSKHNAMAAYLVRKYADIDFGVCLGDYIRGSQFDTEETSFYQYSIVLPQLSWWCDALINGNHDNGMAWWDGYFSSTTLYNLIGNKAINAVRPQTEADRGYYYFDVPGKNLRVIMLNTNDHKGIKFKNHSETNSYNDGHRVSVQQLQWLSSTLASLSEGQKAIVCSHEPIHWFDYTYTDANGITWDMAQNWRYILDAYAGGTGYSFVQDGRTVSGDFSNCSKGEIIGTFHGHTHNFTNGVYGENNIVRVSTPNASVGRTNEYGMVEVYGREFANTYGELDKNGKRVTKYFKTKEGTTNETAFVVNTIDFDKKIIYSDHYGAGYDRVIPYG